MSANSLFPIFLKLEQLPTLLVGGGKVALEKLQAIYQNSPKTHIALVAKEISDEVKLLAQSFEQVTLQERAFELADLENVMVVIVAINDHEVSKEIVTQAKAKGKLVNAADKPDLCDFYLSSVVSKGSLKIAISTNGKSPTLAKRVKELLNDVIPNEIEQNIDSLHLIRNSLKGDFDHKVKTLNQITEEFINPKKKQVQIGEKLWKRIATWFVFGTFFMVVGHLLFSLVSFSSLLSSTQNALLNIDSVFYYMLVAGFLAQLVDGALGMGYGLTCTTIMLSLGIKLPSISGSIHTAEMFSSGISGYSHYKFGNINKKLFLALLLPGVVGAVLGAFLLIKFGDEYASVVKPILAAYTIVLGSRILYKAFSSSNQLKKKISPRIVPYLAVAGGFLDAFGGGGWGPLVTSTLISRGGTPKYIIGSISAAEFFITFASAFTFLSLAGVSHWPIILGLVLGGGLAAPLAARLVGKLPTKQTMIALGVLVIAWSMKILWACF